MKNKVIRPLAIGLLLASAGFSVAACSGGGGGTNYADMNYNDYYHLYDNEQAPEGTEGYWDYWETKKVTYQFANTTGSLNHSFAPYFPTLINLYEDGTIKAWERCIFIGSMFDALEGQTEEESAFYAENGVLELFFGYWELADGTVTLYVQNSCDYTLEGDNIQYKSYQFSTTPDANGIISFYFDATEKGQLIAQNQACDTNYEGNIQYASFVDFRNGKKVGAEEAA